MICKIIHAEIVPGHRDEFVAAQDVWDRECRKSAGYIGQWYGDGEPGAVEVLVFWQTRAAYDAWMNDEHDRIAELARSVEHYTNLEIRIVDGPDGLPSGIGAR